MAISIRLIGLFALVVLISGCKKLNVTIEGQGQVVSSPAGIECGQGKNACGMTINGTVTLTPVAPSDGSYAFAEWIGACTGNAPSCAISKAGSVTARFRSTDEMAAIPTGPRISSANSVTSTHLYVYWTSSVDDVTPAQELLYRVYVARQKDNIVSAGNLMLEVHGNAAGVYEHEIDVSALLASGSTDRSVQAAIVAIDGDGNEGQPSYLYDIPMMQQDIQIRTDIGFHFADEEGYPTPVRDASGIYTLAFPTNATTLPAVGEYIAFKDGSGDDIIKVIGVSGRTVRAERAKISEIITQPIEMSGSSNFTNQPGDTNKRETTGTTREPGTITRPSSSQTMTPAITGKSAAMAIACPTPNPEETIYKADVDFNPPTGTTGMNVLTYKFTYDSEVYCSANPQECADKKVSDFFRLRPNYTTNGKLSITLSNANECVTRTFQYDVHPYNLLTKVGLTRGPRRLSLSNKIDYRTGIKVGIAGQAITAIDFSAEMKISNIGFDITVSPFDQSKSEALKPEFELLSNLVYEPRQQASSSGEFLLNRWIVQHRFAIFEGNALQQ